MALKIRPLHDRILVKRLEEQETKKGGIIIPDTAKEKPQEGKVVAVGNGKVGDDGKRIALDVKSGDKILPIEPGPLNDNPPFLTPAGRVHCSMADWAKYIQGVLVATRGEEGLLQPASVQQLKEPPFGGDYALGWGIVERPWGGGKVFSHAGSNGMNYCVAWVAPVKNFAVLAAANRGGDGAPEGLDKVCSMMIRRFLPEK